MASPGFLILLNRFLTRLRLFSTLSISGKGFDFFLSCPLGFLALRARRCCFSMPSNCSKSSDPRPNRRLSPLFTHDSFPAVEGYQIRAAGGSPMAVLGIDV